MSVRYISLSQMVSGHSERKSSKQNDKIPQADQYYQSSAFGNRLPSDYDRWARHDVESRWKILTMAV